MSGTPDLCGLLRVARSIMLSAAVFLSVSVSSHTQEISGSGGVRRIRINELAVVTARPDTAYILMKVETQSSRLSHAIAETDKRAAAFAAALRDAGIAGSAVRPSNFIVAPAVGGAGYGFARNLIITIEGIHRRPCGEFPRLMAKVQDLGARFGIQCVTCIGSG